MSFNDLSYLSSHWQASVVQINQLQHFAKLIFSTIGKFNLTGHKTLDKIWDKLIVEGLVAYEQLKEVIAKTNYLLDVGTGAGIPGILLKVFFPKVDCYLVESSTKKCNFLNQVISELGLEKITVLNQRIENLGKTYFRKFDFITARALGSMTTCLKWMSPYLNKNGRIALAKSNHADSEYSQCQPVLKEYHLRLEQISQNQGGENLASYDTYVFVRA